jgi:hypothetical protein
MNLPDFHFYVLSQSTRDEIVELSAVARDLALKQVRHHRAVTDGASFYEYCCLECLRAWTDDITPKHTESCTVGKALRLASVLQKVLDKCQARSVPLAELCGVDDRAPAASDKPARELHIEYGDERIGLLPEGADEVFSSHVTRFTHEQAAALRAGFERVQR